MCYMKLFAHKYPFVFICTNVYKKLFGVFYEARS